VPRGIRARVPEPSSARTLPCSKLRASRGLRAQSAARPSRLAAGPNSLKIAFVTPEFEPLVRCTQLADFASALPKALRGGGHDVRVFLPRTQSVNLDQLEGVQLASSARVRDGIGPEIFKIYSWTSEGMPIYLFDHPGLFGERAPFGAEEGPYPDNWRRYGLFARAALAALEPLGFDPEVIHCLDWTTGMIPVFQELEYNRKNPEHPAAKAGSFFQIQNLAIQGAFEREILPKLDVPHRIFQDVGGINLAGKVNFLKAGCEFATVLGTHSPGHALRIQEQDRGYGLEEVFRRRAKELVGITNGIDYQAWDPETDAALPKTFSVRDKHLAGKRRCKAVLQSELKLDNGPRTPVAAVIGRFDSDSGFDLIAEVLTSILEHNFEVVLMGAGRADILDRLKTMEATFTGRCRVIEGYNLDLAHRIMGGSDLLLLPSHYHPGNALCAIGMRYGVVPVIYSSSGLEDFVVDLGAAGRTGTGFHFDPYNGAGLIAAIERARKLYRNAANWKAIQMRCMRQDFSWKATAAEYAKAYRRVTRRVKPAAEKSEKKSSKRKQTA
jgi:starch synthase